MQKSLLELRITAQGFCLYISYGNVFMELFCESCLRHVPRIPVWTSTSAGSCPVMPVWIHLQINSFEEAPEMQVATVATSACSDSSKHVSCVLHLPSCFYDPTWKHAFHLDWKFLYNKLHTSHLPPVATPPPSFVRQVRKDL